MTESTPTWDRPAQFLLGAALRLLICVVVIVCALFAPGILARFHRA